MKQHRCQFHAGCGNLCFTATPVQPVDANLPGPCWCLTGQLSDDANYTEQDGTDTSGDNQQVVTKFIQKIDSAVKHASDQYMQTLRRAAARRTTRRRTVWEVYAGEA